MICAGEGPTWGRMTSLFWVIASLFSRPKFPVRLLREIRPKRPEYRDNKAVQKLRRPEFRKFPCIFPCYQGIWGGDRFAMDCVVSQPVWSPCRTPGCRKCSRHFMTLAPENQSLRREMRPSYALVGVFWRVVSNREFSISEIYSSRLGSHQAETGSHVPVRWKADIGRNSSNVC
jgi:hypothetical protein